ncbi:MAG: HigA family addiction module antidote protein [Proteobacteria bacterium]|nr:HigA family addiction module antidote protein [Pseudomonadota bacterium]MBU1582425.1 HigA family addiction module antidote protein [Pseudomonadota bacterium]MBU2452499.1 HigA family addiction module antidote protein [Pseudomonadota bacterium]MBU2631253.1 HigA family addiction module antidote protein [Pseudomonadota bacterium]
MQKVTGKSKNNYPIPKFSELDLVNDTIRFPTYCKQKISKVCCYLKIRVYLEPNDISSNELARKLKVSPGLISRLINGKTDVSPAMALKLSVVLGRSPESWLLMQDNYDLWKARKEIDLKSYNTIEFVV